MGEIQFFASCNQGLWWKGNTRARSGDIPTDRRLLSSGALVVRGDTALWGVCARAEVISQDRILVFRSPNPRRPTACRFFTYLQRCAPHDLIIVMSALFCSPQFKS